MEYSTPRAQPTPKPKPKNTPIRVGQKALILVWSVPRSAAERRAAELRRPGYWTEAERSYGFIRFGPELARNPDRFHAFCCANGNFSESDDNSKSFPRIVRAW